jgi:hypothetical protein
MSSRTHDEFGIQFPRKRLPKLKNLPTRQGYQVNRMTYMKHHIVNNNDQ